MGNGSEHRKNFIISPTFPTHVMLFDTNKLFDIVAGGSFVLVQTRAIFQCAVTS